MVLYCGHKLNGFYYSDGNIFGYFCANPHCGTKADVLKLYVWQALIDGKKAQEKLIKEKTTHNILQERLTEHQKALEYAIGVLDNLTDIVGVDLEIFKIKKMAGIK